MDIDHIRREYLHGGLSSDNLQSNPFDQFQHWLKQAVDAKVQDPTAMSIATVSADGQPSQRIVLLKDCDERGFVFYTNQGRNDADVEGNDKNHLSYLKIRTEYRASIGIQSPYQGARRSTFQL